MAANVHKPHPLGHFWYCALSCAWTPVKARAERAQEGKLKITAVVGVTCSLAGQPVLNGLRFDVLVLDACCQMVG